MWSVFGSECCTTFVPFDSAACVMPWERHCPVALFVCVAQLWYLRLFKSWMLVMHLRVAAQRSAVWGAAIQLLQAN
jgi:hypothetical protein